jgi:hypothetical protein
MRSHSVGCGMQDRTQSATLLISEVFLALASGDHQVFDESDVVIDTHESAGDFREP